MSVVRLAAGVAAMLGACAFATAVQAADDGSGEFSGSKFTCLQYSNGLGANSSTKAQANMARMWILGYMAGYYKAENKLDMSDVSSDVQRLDSVIAETCRDNPQNSIMTIASQALVKDVRKIPKVVMDLSPGAYTCGEHVDAKAGAADGAAKADLAEMWAFAFIQGYKNVASPGLEIPIENKGAIIGAVNRTCANNRALTYMDLAAAVADKIKMN